MLDLRVVCAWCGLTIRDGMLPISHGICSKCQKELEDDPVFLANVLQLMREAHSDVADEEEA
jgi:hypothetical protein